MFKTLLWILTLTVTSVFTLGNAGCDPQPAPENPGPEYFQRRLDAARSDVQISVSGQLRKLPLTGEIWLKKEEGVITVAQLKISIPDLAIGSGKITEFKTKLGTQAEMINGDGVADVLVEGTLVDAKGQLWPLPTQLERKVWFVLDEKNSALDFALDSNEQGMIWGEEWPQALGPTAIHVEF